MNIQYSNFKEKTFPFNLTQDYSLGKESYPSWILILLNISFNQCQKLQIHHYQTHRHCLNHLHDLHLFDQPQFLLEDWQAGIDICTTAFGMLNLLVANHGPMGCVAVGVLCLLSSTCMLQSYSLQSSDQVCICKVADYKGQASSSYQMALHLVCVQTSC